jgi:hypothetical protein
MIERPWMKLSVHFASPELISEADFVLSCEQFSYQIFFLLHIVLVFFFCSLDAFALGLPRFYWPELLPSCNLNKLWHAQ